MRIADLTVAAYGHFSDLTLEFGESATLHVIYGANEAGKTTLKWAIEELLFGFGARTPYAFLHDYAKLRLRGTLVGAAGSTMSFERLKRRDGDLRTPTGEPLPPNALAPFLQGVTLDMFTTRFSLSREDMAKGAAAILEGKDDLGASLYSAALGNANLSEILESLDQQSAALFAPRASARLLNRAIETFRQAKSAKRSAMVRPDAWDTLLQEKDETSAKIPDLDGRLTALLGELSVIERLRSLAETYSRFVRLRLTLEERAAELTVSAEIVAEVERCQDDLKANAVLIETSRDRITALEGEKEDDPFAALRAKTTDIQALVLGAGAYQKNASDLARLKLAGHAIRNAEEADGYLKRVWPDIDRETARRRAIPEALVSRANELVLEHTTLENSIGTSRREISRLREALEDRQSTFDHLPSALDVAAVRAMLVATNAEGPLDRTILEVQADLQKREAHSATVLKRVGLYAGSLEALQQAALPLSETITNFNGKFQDISARETLSRHDLDEAERRCQAAISQLEAQEREGTLRTLTDLELARDQRDGIFGELAGQWRASASISALDATASRYTPSVEGADELADELRTNANRVLKAEQLVQQRDEATQEIVRQNALLQELAEQHSRLDAEWLQVWSELGIVPKSPDEMLGWLQRADEVRRLAGQADEVRLRLTELTRRRSDVVAGLQNALQAIGQKPPPDETLAPLVAFTTRVVDDADEMERLRKTLVDDLRRDRRDIARHEQTYEHAQQRLVTWKDEWGPLLDTMWLPKDLAPSALSDTIGLIRSFQSADSKATTDEKRARGIEREQEAFRKRTVGFMGEWTPDLVPMATNAPDAAVAEAQKRLNETQQARARQDERRKQIETERAKLSVAERKYNLAEDRLAKIATQVSADTDALFAVIERSKDTLSKRDECTKLRVSLEDGTGLTIEQCDQEYGGRDRTQLDVAAEQLKTQRVELMAERDAQKAAYQKVTTTLADMDTSEIGIAAEADMLAIGAQIDHQARRWAELVIARYILDQQVSAYVEAHQGPLLDRSSSYLKLLTGGAYQRLRAVPTTADKLLVEVVNREGADLSLDALSDGTRDQLYLALRLAALEEYFAGNEPQPLILDDTFVQFDDDRTCAAFAALAEFSQHTQTFYFTHHRACVDAAQRSVSPELLAVHDLAPRWDDIDRFLGPEAFLSA